MAEIKTSPVVFISHSGEEDFLHKLREHLPGYDLIVSDWRDRSGESVAAKVKKDIARADLVVVLLTDAAMRSAWVHQEIGFALGLARTIVPVLDGSTAQSRELPALLAGLEWEPYRPDGIPESALRTAVRIGQCFQENLVKVFESLWEYRAWWATVDERQYAEEKCYWASPHDTWAWIMSHIDQEMKDVKYRTLIRGDLEFDRVTVATYYDDSDEVVCGVRELSAIEEVAVMGNLTVETFWEPDLMDEIETFLRTAPPGHQVLAWFNRVSDKRTRIEVRLSMDQDRAASHRRRLDSLYVRHKGR